MKKTYTTRMPDRVGAFLVASEIISSLGLNITRVSYNKAVDTNMLFIEVEGGDDAVAKATEKLTEVGYILDGTDIGEVVLIEFALSDVPGSVLPVLRLIDSYNFNISYMSSHAEDGGVQHFRMGLMVAEKGDLDDFIKKASSLCRMRIINYDRSEKVLDNTVFYVSFANWIAGKIGLSHEQEMELIVDANLIMELLSERPKAQYETFDYIRRFADRMYIYRGEAFEPRVTRRVLTTGLTVDLIEPPCGSNICIIECGERLIFVDGGLRCYSDESVLEIKRLIPDFETREKSIILTHADVDHCGILSYFDRVYASRKCIDNFADEADGKDNLRERNPIHSPYVRISKILSGYRTPDLSTLVCLGGDVETPEKPFTHIGELDLYGLHFEVYEGRGGHVSGEVVLIERAHRLVFTGDIFINVKDCIPRQHEFNMIAPYLMTSVDTSPEFAKAEREELPSLLGEGRWLICGGHGNFKEVVI